MNEELPPEYKEKRLEEWFALSSDVITKKYRLGQAEHPVPLLLLYCEGLADVERIDQIVLPQLYSMLQTEAVIDLEYLTENGTLQLIHINGTTAKETAIYRIYSGELLLYFGSLSLLFSLELAKLPNRNPEESSTEVSIKGPRDSFTESVVTNIALVRKRLKTSSLCCEKSIIGERSRTSVALLYIDDIINQDVLEEVKWRLSHLKVDALISSAQLEEGLSDQKITLFPTLNYTGRPDFVAQCLLRGRFAILADGTPLAIIAPVNLTLLLKSPEDVHFPFHYVALERVLRLLGLFIAIFLPGFWVSVSAYNLDQIPFPFLATIASSRLGLPLSAPVDYLFMLGLFELFREAGMRLPKAVGQTVAVVGGLIVGDAAIRAGITSPVTLVMASLTTISMFTLVNQSLAGIVTVFRIIILLISATFGMYGFMLSMMGICLYLASLESFGVPYLAPLSPPNFREMVKALLAKPWNYITKRPAFLHPKDGTRRGDEAQ
ncbi:spore germination protein [Paenibacillus thalictri]|uniref:Spore germination protein n=1 Tax=Paenibacillus thalictri TaxID=2527873 RepID=A0A4Q9DQ02_9BACL|nr:spore germination protein [Paenibacillus thalictri]TBL75345.1 spore germination protein [Paenibacillus thalictri]